MKVTVVNHISPNLIPMKELKGGEFAIVRDGDIGHDGKIVMAAYNSREFLLLNRDDGRFDAFFEGSTALVERLPKGTKLEIII